MAALTSRKRGAVYATLVEKVLAKLSGSYAGLVHKRAQTSPARVWELLTGGLAETTLYTLLSDRSLWIDNLKARVEEGRLCVLVSRTHGEEAKVLLRGVVNERDYARVGLAMGAYCFVLQAVTFEDGELRRNFALVKLQEEVDGDGSCVAGLSVSETVAKQLRDLHMLCDGTKKSRWLEFSEYMRLFESLVTCWHFANLQKCAVGGSFKGRSGGSLFDGEEEFFSGNHQYYLHANHAGLVACQLTLPAWKYDDGRTKPTGTRLQLHLFEAYSPDTPLSKASEDEKTRFSTTLVEEFDAVLGTLNAHTDEPQLRDALRTLKKLQEHLVFLPVDKTSHDFGFICKEKYKELLRDELQQSSTYQEVGESIDDVLERHRDFNKSHKFVHADNLPYLYGIPKLHKPEPRMRYIAGVSEKGNVEKKDEQKDRDEKGRDKKRMKTRASTTPAHQEASGLLKLVLATLRSKDEAAFSQTGIRRFFVVESVDDVAVHIKTNYARLRKKAPRTFDFKEMYTKIPQKQIVDYVMSAVAEAFEYMKSEKGANVEAQRAKHRFEFGKPDESNTTSYNVEEIRALVSFIVGNTFVTNGGTCYQQVSGIPMGGNASPDLANLYCYWCEKQYIDGLVAKGLQEEARNHADSVRFIDDFLTWGVRPPPEDIYGMEYGETSKGVDDVVFLGMRIRMERNDKTDFIRMSVLDKGEEFPWNPIKYTHVESTVPRNTGTSIFKGALIRAARICNNMPDLKVEVMK
ncbi:hypothetical protein DIPPA_11747, partial [Diplonema papillatum]